MAPMSQLALNILGVRSKGKLNKGRQLHVVNTRYNSDDFAGSRLLIVHKLFQLNFAADDARLEQVQALCEATHQLQWLALNKEGQ